MSQNVVCAKKRHGKVFSVIKRCLVLLFLSLMIISVYMLPRMSFFTEKVANNYSKKVFPYIAKIFNSVFSLSLNSVTELVVVAGVIPLIALLIYGIVLMVIKIVKGGFLDYIYKVVAALLIITLVFGLSFQLMHGFNYRRTPVEKALKLTKITNRSIEEIIPVYNWAHDEMVAARKELGEDYNGVTHIQTDFDESVYYANILINSVSEYFDLGLSKNYVRAKPVSLSHYWSYTNILGMYNPFFGEANVNVDITSLVTYPESIVHEILHAKGLARESDAELAAILMCCMADRPDFRYSGFLEIYTRLYFILYDMGVKVPFDAGASRDLADYDYYWDSLYSNDFTEVVAEVSETTNDTFLKSNDQEKGVESYIIDNDYYVEFYYNYVDSEIKDD